MSLSQRKFLLQRKQLFALERRSRYQSAKLINQLKDAEATARRNANEEQVARHQVTTLANVIEERARDSYILVDIRGEHRRYHLALAALLGQAKLRASSAEERFQEAELARKEALGALKASREKQEKARTIRLDSRRRFFQAHQSVRESETAALVGVVWN